MKVTSVKVNVLFQSAASLIGLASITLDDELAINDIRIVQGTKRIFVDFPKNAHALKRGKSNIAPLTPDIRKEIETKIMQEYIKEMNIAGTNCPS